MKQETNNCLKLLKEYRTKLTKQQLKTFRGQIIHGDIDGFRKGLFKLIKLQYTK